MNVVRRFLEAERRSALAEVRTGSISRVRSRLELIEWLLDGADDMTPSLFREILADVINGKRQVPKAVTASQASELLQRWIEASHSLPQDEQVS